MSSDFSRSLTLLRKEKGISQRSVAKDLGISQALLSHYENGIREPGLPFVVKACDYYGVSADFLLGRTLNRDGTTIVDAESLFDYSTEKDNVLRGSIMATLSKKLLVNSIGVLFDLLGKLGNKRAIKAAANYLSTSVYQLYRHLCRRRIIPKETVKTPTRLVVTQIGLRIGIRLEVEITGKGKDFERRAQPSLVEMPVTQKLRFVQKGRKPFAVAFSKLEMVTHSFIHPLDIFDSRERLRRPPFDVGNVL